MTPLNISLVSLALVSSVQATTLTIGPDVSSSSVLMTDKHYAEAVAIAVSNKVLALSFGDKIYFKTLGDDSTTSLSNKPLTLSRKMRPEKAASLVKGRISHLAETVQQQGATNIMAFIENGEFHCEQAGSSVWLLTDGIEWSIDFSGQALLNGSPLPEPYGKPLEGCDVVMIGVGRIEKGQRLPRKQIHTLNSAWTTWLNAAGARSVVIMLDPKL